MSKNNFPKIIALTASVVLVSLFGMFNFSEVSVANVFGGLLESSVNVSAGASEESNVMTQDVWNQAIEVSKNK